MAKVKIKGVGSLEVSKEAARALNEDWQKENPPKKAQIKDTQGDIVWSGMMSDVQGFDFTSDGSSEFDDHQQEQELEDYFKWHKEERAKSPEEKAQNLNLFKLVHWAVTGNNKLPNNIKERAIKAQTEFFKENPKRVYCDMHIFVGLKKFMKQDINPEASNRFRKAAMDIVERSLAEDIYVAKRT